MSMMVQPGRFGAAPYRSGTDASFASTVLLLGFQGADASTTVTDESAAAHGTATVQAQAQIDTAQFKFGSSSGLFDGSGDTFYWADHADFELGTGNFCIELWYRTPTAAGDHRIFSKFAASGTFSFLFRQNGATYNWLTSTNGTGFNTDITAGTIAVDTWYHLAIDFDGTKTRLFVDGVMVGSTTTLRSFFDGTAVMTVGNDGGFGATATNGWIQEFRFTKATRYGSDSSFSPPTAPFPGA